LKERRVKLADYVASGMIASGPAWVLSILIHDLSSPLLQLSAFVGAAIGGMLLTRKSASSDLRTEMTLGLTSFIFYFIFLTLGGIGLEVKPDALCVMAFVAGAAIGARFWQKFTRKQATG
jgi:uncharacterized protein YneF (UPF0154 family)